MRITRNDESDENENKKTQNLGHWRNCFKIFNKHEIKQKRENGFTLDITDVAK